jgi:phospholipid transport system transporter-binding protein
MQPALQITGDLTLATLPRWLADGKQYVKEQAGHAPVQLTLDFSQVEVIDSSAVALLLEWRREAKRNSSSLAFQNLPENLLELASVYGVEALLAD